MRGDLWKVIDGFFTINTTTAVNVTALDAELSSVTPASNMVWNLLEAQNGIFLAGNNPSLSDGYSYVKDTANPPTWWHLKSN